MSRPLVSGQRPTESEVRGPEKVTAPPMTGHPCTQHGPENRRNGRCQVCRHAARKRYQRSRIEAYHKLQTIEAALAS